MQVRDGTKTILAGLFSIESWRQSRYVTYTRDHAEFDIGAALEL